MRNRERAFKTKIYRITFSTLLLVSLLGFGVNWVLVLDTINVRSQGEGIVIIPENNHEAVSLPEDIETEEQTTNENPQDEEAEIEYSKPGASENPENNLNQNTASDAPTIRSSQVLQSLGVAERSFLDGTKVLEIGFATTATDNTKESLAELLDQATEEDGEERITDEAIKEIAQQVVDGNSLSSISSSSVAGFMDQSTTSFEQIEEEVVDILEAKVLSSTGESVVSEEIAVISKNGELVIQTPTPSTQGLYAAEITLNNPITGTSEKITQEFQYGLLVANTNQDKYLPGTTGQFAYGVLDSNGIPICDSILSASITHPDGQREDIEVIDNGQCNVFDSQNIIPDYQASYKFGGPGVYESTTVTNIQGVEHTFVQEIEVIDGGQNIVKRSGATRLYPAGFAPMRVEVLFDSPYTGTIRDTLPDGFEIQGEEFIEGSWSAGEIVVLEYEYNAPDISPYIYTIENNLESRPWNIANDRIVNGNDSNSTAGGTDGNGPVYTQTINIDSSDLPLGSVINDVDLTTVFDKTDFGTSGNEASMCATSSYAGGSVYNNEIVIRLQSPSGTAVNIVNQNNYSGNAYGGVVTAVWDEAAGSGPSGTPSSGTFNPVGNLNSFNGQSPFGNWTITYDDTANQDPLCIISATLDFEVEAPGVTVTEIGGNTEFDQEGENDKNFTVVLDTQPSGNVVVDVTPSDSQVALNGAGASNPIQLTFTPANWSTAQNVNVLAVDDSIAETPPTSTLITTTINISGTADSNYDAVPASSINTVTANINGDNDTAGITFNNAANKTVNEHGAADTYEVVLESQPTADVTVAIDPGDQLDVGVGANIVLNLTFTPANWNIPQTVTIAPNDDFDIEGAHTGTITHSSSSTDTNYNSLTLTDIVVDIVDNDELIAEFTTIGFSAPEDAPINFYLNVSGGILASPTDIDVLDLGTGTATDLDDYSFGSPRTVTIPADNYTTPRPVLIGNFGVNSDNIHEDDETIILGLQSTNSIVTVGDANGNGGTISQFVRTIVNDDTAGVVLTSTNGSTEAPEGMGDEILMRLGSEPTGNVTIEVTADTQIDLGNGAGNSYLYTFTPSNWNIDQTISISPVDDAIVEGSHTGYIDFIVTSGDSYYDNITVGAQSVDITDNDVAGFTLSNYSVSVNENGGTVSVTAVLDAAPINNVIFNLTSSDNNEVTVAPTPLTFNSSNWNIPQTITLTGVDDDIIGPTLETILVSVDPNSDGFFNSLSDQSIGVTVIEDDVAGVTVVPIDQNLSEPTGDDGSFSLVLNSQPQSDVTIPLSSSDATEGTVPASVTFTSSNWDTPQIITVTVVDDVLGDGAVSFDIITGDVTSLDLDYESLGGGDVDDVTMVTANDDPPGVEVTIGDNTTSESGDNGNFDVRLLSQPTNGGDVIIPISVVDTTEGSVSITEVVIANADWNVWQQVTVTGVDDDLDDGDQNYFIALGDPTSTDPIYDALDDSDTPDVGFINMDDDSSDIIIESLTAIDVTEGGSGDTFMMRLGAQPTANVDVTLTAHPQFEFFPCFCNSVTLTFTPDNWDINQIPGVVAIDDTIAESFAIVPITYSVSSSDTNYNGLTVPNTDVEVSDNDNADIIIIQSGGQTDTSESGTTDIVDLVLDSQPTANVEITISPDSQSGVGFGAGVSRTIVFTPSNWNIAQTITVDASNDQVVEGTHTSKITLSVNSADSSYNSLVLTDIDNQITDNDTAGFSVSSGAITVPENGGSESFTAVLDGQPQSDVVLTASSFNAGEVISSSSTITFTPANWDTPQLVTVTGVDDNIDRDDSTSIILSVDDASSDDYFDALLDQAVAINLIDDDTAGFTITPGSLNLIEGGASDDFSLVLNSEPTSNVVILISSSDTGAATTSPTSLTFSPSNWNSPQTYTVTPVDDDDILDENVDITFSIDDASSDDVYDLVSDQTISVVVTDDEVAGFSIDPSLSISEGGNGVISIVLLAQPQSDVVIDLSSSDIGAALINPTSLTFNSSDWNTPQTVTVTGEEDDDLANETVTVTATINDVLTDDDWDALSNQSSIISVSDNDTASIVVSPGSITINENVGTGSFTVVLGAEPQSDVVIDLSSSSTLEAVLSPSSLTFTPGNWDTPQTVTVTGVDDSFDRDDTATITVSVNDGGSDDDFDSVPDETITVILADDDTAGINVTETGGTAITEGGATDTISYVLSSEPFDDVTLTITPDSQIDLGGGSGLPVVLSFTPGNWNIAQIVTLAAVDDVAVEGTHTSLLSYVVSSSDGDYNNFVLPDTSSTITDNDTAGFSLTPNSLIVDENGGTGSFDAVLTAQPLSDVTLTIVSDNTGEATVSLSTITFTSANWDTPQTVTVTGVDDNIDRDDVTTITASIQDGTSDDAFDPVADQSVAITLTDDDTFGVVVSAISGNVSEDGTTATFTVNLTSEPLGDVTIDLSSSDTSEGLVPGALFFPAVNWATTATITVTGVDDEVDDGDVNFSIITGDVTSTDPLYDGLIGTDLNDVSVVNVDNDTAGFTLSQTSGTTEATEGGSGDQLTYVLNSQPTEDVTIIIATDAQTDVGGGPIAPWPIVFTSANWDTPQTITVNAYDDTIEEGTHSGSINSTATSLDPNYEGATVPDVTVSITDNDNAGINITHSGGITQVIEGGTTDTLSYTLNSEPISEVTVTITPDGEVDFGSGPGVAVTLTFTPANWNISQDITITAVDDNLIEGAHNGSASYTFSSSDTNYSSLTRSPTNILITDNDTAGFTINTLTAETVNEENSATIYSVVLDSQPTSNVVITIGSDNTDSLTVNTSTLTFTPSNWNTAQSVIVSAPDEANVVGESVNLSFAVDDANSDDDFDSLASQSKTVTVLDNDTAGFSLSTNTLSVGENAGTNIFTVVLDSQPASDVVILITSDAPGEATASPASITFSPASWDTPQTVVVTGTDDDIISTDSATITVSIDDTNSDDNWDGEADETIVVSIIEDDTAGFVVSEVDNLTDETGDTGTFSITLNTIPTSDVTIPLSVTDSTEGSVPASITITPANWNVPQVVTVTGVDDNIFDGSITYTVITGDPTSPDPNYDNLIDTDIIDIVMDNQDDDPPGIIINVVDSTSEESGAAAVLQFTLVSQIAGGADITIPLSLSDTSEGDLNGVTSITIANADWNNPSANEVQILGVDDAVADGDIFYNLITGDPITTNILYSVLTASDIADPLLQNMDNDTAGVVITQTNGDTTAIEGNLGDNYEVVLSSEPTGDVTVTISPDGQIDVGEGAGNSINLTFTTADWNTPQTVSLNAFDDLVAEGSHSGPITHTSLSTDSDYDSASVAPVIVDITDNDTPELLIIESGSTDVFEDGAVDSYNLVLATEPTADVVVTITPDSQVDLGGGVGVAINRTFTPINWDTPQTIVVTAIDDNVDEGIHNSTITHSLASTDPFYDGLGASDVVVNIADNDISGVTIDTGTGLDVAEGGASDSLAAVLDSQPAGDVIITITPDSQTDLGNGIDGAITITFTPIDWNLPQSIPVTASDDSIAEGNHNSTITYSISSSSDNKYDDLTIPDTIANITDNDNTGVILNVIDSTTGEDGSTATIEVTLNSEPTSDVTIDLTTDDATEGNVNSSITIAPADWNNGAANIITVTGVNDVDIDGAITYQLITGNVSSSDSFYDALDSSSVADVTLTNGDNDVDSDGDGVPDEQEDLDGSDAGDPSNYQDSDGDGVPDYVENQQGSDPNDDNDYLDTDNGGTPDFVETVLFPNSGLTPTDENTSGDDDQDSDGDGVPDYQEIIDGADPQDPTSYQDSDGDLVPDYVENTQGSDPNTITDYLDSDGDLVPDYIEVRDGTDPNNPLDYIDTDGNLVPDYVENIYDNTDPNDDADFADADNGGAADYIEMILLPNSGLTATDEDDGSDDNQDTDGDSVPDWVELVDGTDPQDNTSYTDTDGDLVPDYVEDQQGTDPNNINQYLDTDGDGVPDYIEARDGTDPNNSLDYQDTDGDQVPDYIEVVFDNTDEADGNDFADTDNGGAPDYVETTLLPNNGLAATDPNTSADDVQDTDGDGVPDWVELLDGTDPQDDTSYIDTDGDQVPDYVEGQESTDPNLITDYLDSDNDGVPDYVEIREGTNPNDGIDYTDTDGDLVPDYVETILDGTDPNDDSDFNDTDNGGVADYVETYLFPNYGLPATNPNDPSDDNQDSDGDGVPDGAEISDGTDPSDPNSYLDTDGDLVPDYVENTQNTNDTDSLEYLDSDEDGVPDYIEELDGTDPNDSTSFVDSDNGGVPDYVESTLVPNLGLPATDPNNNSDDLQDSDGDGVPDYIEYLQNTDPNNINDYRDTDSDGVPDYVESDQGRDPNNGSDYQDSDGDGVPDYIETTIDNTDSNDSNDYKDRDNGGVPDYIETVLLPNLGTSPLDPTDPSDDTIDSDGDGVPDIQEVIDGTDPSDSSSYTDTDGDQVPDYVEGEQGSDPNNVDSYLDSDGDGVPDYVEIREGTDPSDPLDYQDSDGDNVPDYIETIQDNTNPNVDTSFQDSDGGGMPDYTETTYLPNMGLPALDPNDPSDDTSDTDGDTVPDYIEIRNNTDVSNPDDDLDGVTTAEEYGAPNDGDGNGDGILDYAQPNVASRVNQVTGSYSSLEVGECEVINGFDFVTEASLAVQDTTAEYFIGLHGFELDCGNIGDTANITVIWDQEYDTSSWVYKKFNPNTGEYSFIDNRVTLSTRTIGGETKTITEYSITDGGELDIDGQANGTIIDPAGPAIPNNPAETLLRTGGRRILTTLPYFMLSLGCISLWWVYNNRRK